MSLDELITAANQLNEADLEQLFQQVMALRMQRKAQVLLPDEAKLLERINRGVPVELRAQYEVLRAKREAETLTEEEYENLIELSQRIEQFGAERLKAFIELAQLELTLQEAAVFLQVSCSYLKERVEAGELLHHGVEPHQRIRFDDLMAYRKRVAIAQSKAIDELVAESEAMGLYD